MNRPASLLVICEAVTKLDPTRNCLVNRWSPFGWAARHCLGLLLLSCLLFIAAVGMAQSPAYTHYSLDNGLSSSTVYGAIQDHNGYIWFATESGASRFDGKTFENFTVADGLSGNDVLSLFEDSKGRIWFFPFNQHVSFYASGLIHNVETDPWLKSVIGRNFVTSYLEDAAHTIWMGEDGGKIFKVFADNHVEVDSSLGADQVRNFRGLYLNRRQEVMSCSNSLLYNLTHKVAVQHISPSLDKFLPLREARISVDTMLYGIADRFLLIVGDRATALHVAGRPIADEILFLRAGRRGDLWVGTRNGAMHITDYAIEDSSFTILQMSVLLPGKSVSSVLEDEEGYFWLTSIGEGVFFFPSVDAKSYALDAKDQTSFCNKVFVDRRGRVWLGFDRSLYGTLADERLDLRQNPLGLTGRGRMTDIFEDQRGNVFFLMDASTVILEANGHEILVPAGSKAITQLRDGRYALCHSWELDLLNTVSLDQFAQDHKAAQADLGALLKKRSISLYCAADASLYIGTLGGLYVWDGQTVSQMMQVPPSSISDIAESADGTIWISSLSRGIGYLREGKFTAITLKDGLASNICHGLAVDDPDVVFVATNRGISRIERTDAAQGAFKIDNYGKNFGLASDEVRSVAVDHEKIYAATALGLTVLDKDFLTAIPPTVKVHIQRFSAAGRPLRLDSMPIQLVHAENRLSLDFTGISFRNADKLLFSYQLQRDGQEGNWIPTNSRQLEFPSLAAGSYVLHIRAMVDGLPATTGESMVAFEVLPAYWEKSWFLVVAILIGAALLVGLFFVAWRRLRLQERRRTEINHRIAASEQKALRAQMNPHFIFNSLNSIDKFFITYRAHEGNAYMADFSDLIRSILELSGKPHISLRDEIAFVELFLRLETLRMDHRFTYTIVCDPNLPLDLLTLPPMIVQPFVENAVWHGLMALDDRQGHIQIGVALVPNGFQIVVDDNGIGRQRSAELNDRYRKKHKSSGMRITTERLELLNLGLPPERRFAITVTDLLHADNTVAGTRVVLFIPNQFSTIL